MIQNEIENRIDLLDENGYITNEGWARKPFWEYERRKISAHWIRIKEWDYYYILSHDKKYGVTFTMSDIGYMSLFAITWLDFQKKTFYQIDSIGILPKGHIRFPESSLKGDLSYNDKKISINCILTGNKRIITAYCPRFKMDGKKCRFEANIVLECDPNMDSVNIATSWKENRKAFYYNQKINCMPAKGTVKIDDTDYIFEFDNSFAGLDWGRGRWTYKNRWYWGSASGIHNKNTFGFNIGYGFSDRSSATENAIFYKNKIHKLDQVKFVMDTSNYLNPWKFVSNDGRFEMNFEPIIDRNSKIDLFVLKSIQHQVFGYFSGTVVLDNNEKLYIDKILGFAEDVFNMW